MISTACSRLATNLRTNSCLWIGLALTGLLSACAQNTLYTRPELPVPTQWPGVASGTAALDAKKTHWRSFFTDPQLQTLIVTALLHNRDLHLAAARVQEARAQLGVVRADQSPTVNILGSGSASRAPAELDANGVAANSQRFDLALSAVSFELDFWGRLARLSDAARLSYLATEEAQRAVQISLIADVASAYFSVLQMNDLAGVARHTVSLRDQTLALISVGKALGGADEFVQQQARGSLESAIANLASLEHQGEMARNRLNFLVGKVGAPLPQDLTLLGLDLQVGVGPGLPGEVLLLRPDVIATEQRLMAAHANVDAARAAFLPRVLLTASLGVASQGLSNLFSGGAWAFQPVMSLPLFDGGRNASAKDLAEARKNVAVAEYEKTLQLAFREVADLLSARSSLTRQLEAQLANTQAQRKRLVIAQARFSAGAVSFLEVLDAQREALAAEQVTAQIRRAQLESAAQLYKALGGGVA